MSRVYFTASTIAWAGSSIASRISGEVNMIVLGSPVTRSRPLTSAAGSSVLGQAEATAIFNCSAVRSPSSTLCSFLTQSMIASSSSSPPIRADLDTTMPPSEMTATSVVPPPMSTIMEPAGSWIGSPTPIAAAIGSSIVNARRAPA